MTDPSRTAHDIWSPNPRETQGVEAWPLTVGLVLAVTLVRIAALFISRLELYPDEAQYWVWSRHLAFGYFSKPPMIAWLIRATTAIGGDGEAWVRLSAPILHGAAALALARAGGRLYGGKTGLWAAVFYTAIPGVQLSSAVMSTDAPLLFFISLAVWAYAAWWTETTSAGRLRAAVALGLALGAAMLTKYAALYIAGGIALHAVLSREARRRWEPGAAAAVVIGMAALASPNLIWNAAHHFQTVAHTAENADLGGADRGLKGLFGSRGPFGFVLGQFWVFGPVPFAVAALGAWRARRPDRRAEDLLLLSLAAPAFVIVFGEAAIARANANWAAAAYPPTVVLAAALLERWRARRWRTVGLAIQAVIAGGFLLGVLTPGLADAVGAGAAFKRARGWAASTAAIRTKAVETGGGPYDAVAVDDRFLFNALSYYGRDAAGVPAAALPAPLKIWVHLARPANQAEAESPLRPANGKRVFAVSANLDYLPAFKADFAGAAPVAQVRVPLDPRHDRLLDLFVGEGFSPRPRDPVTGRPTAR